MRRFLPGFVFVFVVLLSYAALTQDKPTAAAGQKKGGHTDPQACHNTGPYTTTCNPFGADKKAHAVDKTCGITGDAKSDGDKAQDKQKNNLCASASGSPHEVKVPELKTLQENVDKSNVDYGSVGDHHQGPPADRATLFTQLPPGSTKEGDLVSFVGYIVEAKGGSSETVNCHCPDLFSGGNPLSIDVHMALADHPVTLAKATKDATLCTDTFVAETIPHLRPASLELAAIQPLVGKKIVKVTGQIFFDGSHRPCQGTTRGSSDPARFTVWEIHPVYKIEVCTKNTINDCGADSANWQPAGGTAAHHGTTHKGGKKKGST